jgi:hypothetical protein
LFLGNQKGREIEEKLAFFQINKKMEEWEEWDFSCLFLIAFVTLSLNPASGMAFMILTPNLVFCPRFLFV